MLMASPEISKSLSGSLPIDGYHTVECELFSLVIYDPHLEHFISKQGVPRSCVILLPHPGQIQLPPGPRPRPPPIPLPLPDWPCPLPPSVPFPLAAISITSGYVLVSCKPSMIFFATVRARSEILSIKLGCYLMITYVVSCLQRFRKIQIHQ